MAEVTETEVEKTEDLAAFAAGFEEAAPETTRQPDDAATGQQPGQPPEASAPPADEHVQLTRKDFDKLMAAAEQVVTLAPQFDKVYGTIGNLKQQQEAALARFQSQMPSGGAIKVDGEAFAELRENFPELAGQIERIFTKASVSGTGAQPAAAEIDPERIRELARAQHIRDQLEELNDLHPDWQTLVGRPEDQTNEFRQWLATQPEDYRNRIINSTSARVTGRAIDRFLEERERKAAPAGERQDTTTTTQRRARIYGAVQPTGTGTRPAPKQPTAEDEFRSGFLSG